MLSLLQYMIENKGHLRIIYISPETDFSGGGGRGGVFNSFSYIQSFTKQVQGVSNI